MFECVPVERTPIAEIAGDEISNALAPAGHTALVPAGESAEDDERVVGHPFRLQQNGMPVSRLDIAGQARERRPVLLRQWGEALELTRKRTDKTVVTWRRDQMAPRASDPGHGGSISVIGAVISIWLLLQDDDPFSRRRAAGTSDSSLRNSPLCRLRWPRSGGASQGSVARWAPTAHTDIEVGPHGRPSERVWDIQPARAAAENRISAIQFAPAGFDGVRLGQSLPPRYGEHRRHRPDSSMTGNIYSLRPGNRSQGRRA